MLPRGPVERLLHLAEDVHAPAKGLVERLAHDLRRDAGHLDVHLQRRDADWRCPVTLKSMSP